MGKTVGEIKIGSFPHRTKITSANVTLEQAKAKTEEIRAVLGGVKVKGRYIEEF